MMEKFDKSKDVTTDKDNFIQNETGKHIKSVFGPWYGLLLIVIIGILIFFIINGQHHIFGAIHHTFGALMPVVYGVCIAYIINPLMKFIERIMARIYKKKYHKRPSKRFKKTSRAVGIAVSIIFAILIIYLLFSIIMPSLITTVIALVNSLPDQINQGYTYVYNKLQGNKYIATQLQKFSLDLTKNVDDWLNDDLVPWLQSELLPNVNSLASGIANGVINVLNILLDLIIGFIVAIYLLASKERFTATAQKIIYGLFNKRHSEIIMHYSRVTNEMFGGFISGKLVDSAIIGIVCFIFFSIVHMPYALLVSVIMGVANVIPVFGQYIGAAPSILLILLVSPMKCLCFVIFIIILKEIDGNLLGPAILGSSTGLSAFWVLFAILLFGGFFGIVGMLIGVPLFAVIYRIIKDYIEYRLIKKSLEKNTIAYVNLRKIEISENGRNKYIPYTEYELEKSRRRHELEDKISLASIIFSNETISENSMKYEMKKANKEKKIFDETESEDDSDI